MKPALLLGFLLTFQPVFALGGAHGTGMGTLPPPPPPAPPPPPTPATGSIGAGTGGAAPAPANPSTPSGGKPTSGTPSTGGSVPTGGPSGPTGPSTAGGTPYRAPGGVATGVPATATVDVTTWEYWWLYNKDAYVDLKNHIAASSIVSGGDGGAQSALQWDRVGEQVVPEILRALGASDDYDSTLASLVALARLCDGSSRAHAAEIAAACGQRERASNRAVAEGAVLALGIVGHEPSAIELCALMRDQESARAKLGGKAVQSRTRAFAALSLGLLGARTPNEDVRRYVVHHVVQQLAECADEQPDLQAACAIAVGMIPLASYAAEVPQIAKPGANRADVARSQGLANLLEVLGDARAPTFVRAHLPRAIANLAGAGAWRETAARALLARLADRQERTEIVLGCVLALGGLADSSANPLDREVRAALVKQLDAPDAQARCFAVMALAQAAGRGEGAAVDDVRQLLVRNLTTKTTRERCWSALALGVLEHARGRSAPPAVAQALRRALVDAGSPEEIGASAIGCGLAGIAAATPTLVARLADTKEVRAQGYVGMALGFLGAREALAPLRKLLDESRLCSEKLPQTATALALLEDPLLVTQLVELLGRGTSQSTLQAACAALGTVGDRRAIEPLLAVVHDTKVTPHARAAAIAALGRVCDRDRLPWQHAVSAGLNYRAMTVTLSDHESGGMLDLM